jgi:thymidylate kinase
MFYHPRFNDAQHFSFNYNISGKMMPEIQTRPCAATIHIPRDVVYQISHMTCLKYLISVKDKKILLDRCFLSEMVYNELYDKQIYNEFVSVLKNNFEYKIFFLTVNTDEALKNRIIKRLKDDATKTYGIRNSGGFMPEPETIAEKMKAQRTIEGKYQRFIDELDLNTVYIDTSNKTKKEVADIIYKETFKK